MIMTLADEKPEPPAKLFNLKQLSDNAMQVRFEAARQIMRENDLNDPLHDTIVFAALLARAKDGWSLINPLEVLETSGKDTSETPEHGLNAVLDAIVGLATPSVETTHSATRIISGYKLTEVGILIELARGFIDVVGDRAGEILEIDS